MAETLTEGVKAAKALEAKLIARLDAMDKAVQLLQDFANKSPTIDVVNERIIGLDKLHNQKFVGVAELIYSLKESILQSRADTRTAVDAAFAAAKEAVAEQNRSNALAINKSEQAFIKSVDQLGELVKTMGKASDEKIADLKDRLTLIEGKSSISDPSTTEALHATAGALTALKASSDIGAGRSKGSAEGWLVLAAIIGAGSGIASVVVVLARLAGH